MVICNFDIKNNLKTIQLISKKADYSDENIILDDIVENLDEDEKLPSQRYVQSAKSSLRKNEPSFSNLNDPEELTHEIRRRLGDNLYERLANNTQVKVQNYMKNEDTSSSMNQRFSRKNQRNAMSTRNDVKLSKYQKSIIEIYGNQTDSPRTQYRDLMTIPKKTEQLASDNARSQGMIKR